MLKDLAERLGGRAGREDPHPQPDAESLDSARSAGELLGSFAVGFVTGASRRMAPTRPATGEPLPAFQPDFGDWARFVLAVLVALEDCDEDFLDKFERILEEAQEGEPDQDEVEQLLEDLWELALDNVVLEIESFSVGFGLVVTAEFTITICGTHEFEFDVTFNLDVAPPQVRDEDVTVTLPDGSTVQLIGQ